ncbi:hypothetical protein VULLAG_LOCUS23709 [Vulpes lagopus]
MQDLLFLGQKSAQEAAGALPGCGAQLTGRPGRTSFFRVVAAFFGSGYQNASPLLSCWRFITQTSSPSSLEHLRTHFPGANTQEGGKVAASHGQKPTSERPGRKTSSVCPGRPRARAPSLLPPTSQPPGSPSWREPSLGRAILHLHLWDSYL